MQIFLNDLSKESWFTDLPIDFRTLGSNEYFCFFYEYDYENTKLIVNRTTKLTNVNIFIYGSIQTSEENLGYFRQPFDTKDTLFYYFLRTYIGDKAKDFILKYKEKDDERLKAETPSYKFGDVEISDRITFQDAVSKFLLKGSQINPVVTIADSLDSYLMKKFNKSLYGHKIKKFVRLIKHSAEGREKGSLVDLFLIPAENGKVRYMIVGENSELFKDSESLAKAKEMLRYKYSAEKIYQDTGWYFNKYDSKFRKMIDDAGFKINENDLKQVGESIIFYPDNCPIKDDEIYNNCVTKPQTDNWGYLISKGYNGKLGDAFYHPTLFKHYPQLYNMPFYYAQRLNGDDSNGNYSYRYDPNKKDIVVCGYSKSIDSILLHEIQHAIQDIEGFATGGNQFLASMVNEAGGGEIREFMIYSTKLTNSFCDEISKISDEEFEKFKAESKSYLFDMRKQVRDWQEKSYSDKNYEQLWKNHGGYLLDYTNTLLELILIGNYLKKEDVIKNCYQICIYTIALYRYINDANEMTIQLIFNKFIKLIGLEKDIKIVKNLSDVIFKSNRVNKSLSDKGFGEKERNRIIFQTYLNLFGEMEARTVQNIAYLESDLRVYFLPYTSETLDLKSFSVIIDKNDDFLNERKIEAGIERTNDDKYIFHLTPSITVVPLIHELGHLVFDIFQDLGMTHFIEQVYLNNYTSEYPNSDEFFSDYFSAYISRLQINDSITNDLNKFERLPINQNIDFVLDSMFNVKKNEEIEIYLDYLKKLSENE